MKRQMFFFLPRREVHHTYNIFNLCCNCTAGVIAFPSDAQSACDASAAGQRESAAVFLCSLSNERGVEKISIFHPADNGSHVSIKNVGLSPPALSIAPIHVFFTCTFYVLRTARADVHNFFSPSQGWLSVHSLANKKNRLWGCKTRLARVSRQSITGIGTLNTLKVDSHLTKGKKIQFFLRVVVHYIIRII